MGNSKIFILMKALIVITQIYKLGGAENLAIKLVEDLNEKGVEADLLIFYRDLNYIRQIDLVSEKINNVFFLNLKPNTFDLCSIKAIRNMRKIIYNNNYDIIETSDLKTSLFTSIALRFMTLSTRHVFGVHKIFESSEKKGLKVLFWYWILKFDKRLSVYTVSNYAKKHWETFFHIPPNKATTIYNCVTDDFFQNSLDKLKYRTLLGIPGDAHVLIFVGRLVTFKGFDKITYALSSNFIKDNIYLIYLGDVDPQYVASSEKLESDEVLLNLKCHIDKYRLERNVLFLGHRTDVREIMAVADVLVHPTIKESFGLVLVEAMALGLLIVASNKQAIPEILSDTDSILIDPNNLDEIKNSVLNLLSMSNSEKEKMRIKGYKRANNFKLDNRTRMMIKFYNGQINLR